MVPFDILRMEEDVTELVAQLDQKDLDHVLNEMGNWNADPERGILWTHDTAEDVPTPMEEGGAVVIVQLDRDASLEELMETPGSAKRYDRLPLPFSWSRTDAD